MRHKLNCIAHKVIISQN